MPHAVTHVLLTIIAVDIYRDHFTKHRRYFPLWLVLVAGIAGLLPDIDLLIGWILSPLGVHIIHGSVTHTAWFAAVFFVPGLIYLQKKDIKNAVLFFVISFGVIFHVFLDWFLGGGMHEGVMWLFPFSNHAFQFHLMRMTGMDNLPLAVDAVILVGWLSYMVYKHKIKDFI